MCFLRSTTPPPQHGLEDAGLVEELIEEIMYYLRYMKCGKGFLYKNQYRVELCDGCYRANPEIYGFQREYSHVLYRPNETHLTCQRCRQRPRNEQAAIECDQCTDKLLDLLLELSELGLDIEGGPHCYYRFDDAAPESLSSTSENDNKLLLTPPPSKREEENKRADTDSTHPEAKHRATRADQP